MVTLDIKAARELIDAFENSSGLGRPYQADVDFARPGARYLIEALDEIERLTAVLHRFGAHPDYEYETTRTARKSADSLKPEGDGWEPSFIIACSDYKDGVVVATHWRNWERFEFHEIQHWKRRRAAKGAP